MEEIPQTHKGTTIAIESRSPSARFATELTNPAIIYSNPGTLATRVIDVETPNPQRGEILIRLYARG